jgi:hypothetical protein
MSTELAVSTIGARADHCARGSEQGPRGAVGGDARCHRASPAGGHKVRWVCIGSAGTGQEMSITQRWPRTVGGSAQLGAPLARTRRGGRVRSDTSRESRPRVVRR